ncbi:hypothetical protein RCL1_007677 [Eukaryota sp. TZLM3-RCL]
MSSDIIPTNGLLKSQSKLKLFTDSNGSLYCLKKVENSVASDRFCFLTTLKHPCLLKYYHLTDQQNGEVAEEYCPFGSLSDLIQAQHKFSANDLWCVLTQLVYLFDFLLKREILLNDFTLSNVFVSSFHPIRIKVSRIYRSELLLSSYETKGTPFFVFEKENDFKTIQYHLTKFLKQFFQFFLNRVRPCISFRRHDQSNLIEEEDAVLENDFQDFFQHSWSLNFCKNNNSVASCVETNFSSLFVLSPVNITRKILFSGPVLYHVFVQSILRFDTTLLEFLVEKDAFRIQNPNFSIFATKIINISSGFRNLFLRAFDYCCSFGGHLLTDHYPSFQVYGNSLVKSSCSDLRLFSLLKPRITCVKWLNKFPVTTISTKSLNNPEDCFTCFSSVMMVELLESGQDLTELAVFPNLSTLYLHNISPSVVENLSQLTCCLKLVSLKLSPESSFEVDLTLLASLNQLTSISLHDFIINDLAPISSLENLSSLSLKGSVVYDLLPLQHLPNLSYLDLRKTPLSREFRRIVRGRTEVKKVVNSFTDIIHLDLSKVSLRFIDIALYINHLNLKSFCLASSRIANIQLLSVFKYLETLDLTRVVFENDNDGEGLTDLHFLSNCTSIRSLTLDNCKLVDLGPLSLLLELVTLSLRGTYVFDLSPLKFLTKLSTLDVRETLLPVEHQILVYGFNEINSFIEYCQPQPLHFDFSKRIEDNVVDLSLFANLLRVKSLNLSHRIANNITFISTITHLEVLDLTAVEVGDDFISNSLENIFFISLCSSLKSMTLDGCQVTDLKPLSKLFHLHTLSLNCTGVSDLSPLSCLYLLARLCLRNTMVSDLAPLRLLSKLSHLDLRKTNVSRPGLYCNIDEVRAIVACEY